MHSPRSLMTTSFRNSPVFGVPTLDLCHLHASHHISKDNGLVVQESAMPRLMKNLESFVSGPQLPQWTVCQARVAQHKILILKSVPVNRLAVTSCVIMSPAATSRSGITRCASVAVVQRLANRPFPFHPVQASEVLTSRRVQCHS